MKKYNYEMSDKFIDYFEGRVKQVFFYVTEECHLRCKQCLYKPNLFFKMNCRREIPLEELKQMAEDFYKMGARKATVMGGEPSKYGSPDHKELCEFIKTLKNIGYNYVRMDSNGQFEDNFLELDGIKMLDEISFSIDGHTAKINDALRGKGAYKKCVANIKKAISLGYTVDLTTCVSPLLLNINKTNKRLELDNMIRFADRLHVRTINFHVLFKHGFPMDTWTEDTACEPKDWIRVRDEIYDLIKKGTYKLNVRIPYHFITQKQFDSNPKYYGYCPAKLGERLLVHPDGQIRICSGLISSKYCVAKYYDKKIVWEEGYTNELTDHKLNESTPCTNQSKSMDCDGYCPLCFSFKPYQKEYVWENEIKWED